MRTGMHGTAGDPEAGQPNLLEGICYASQQGNGAVDQSVGPAGRRRWGAATTLLSAVSVRKSKGTALLARRLAGRPGHWRETGKEG